MAERHGPVSCDKSDKNIIMTKMRVAIYVPYVPDENTTPPLGPLYLLSVLENKGFDVWLFDERLEKMALNKLLEFKPDIVGISAVTAAYNRGLEAAKRIKSLNSRIKTVFGGPHPSALPETVIKEQAVDFVCVSESEISLSDLCCRVRDNDLSCKSLQAVSNLFYKDGNNVCFTDRRKLLSGRELDALPFPAFHRMDIDAYFSNTQAHGLFKKGKRILPLMSARGCPSKCTFCCRVMGDILRERSVESVISEIKYLIATFGVDEIYFEDDNFTLNKKRALEILDKIAFLSPGIYIKFANGIRADALDRDLLSAMKRAGAYSLSFGIESGCTETLKKMHKRLNIQMAKENILLARSMGFFVGSNCIIGYPGETVHDIEESLKYFLDLPLDSMAIVNLVPFPGTEVRKICKENNCLTKEAQNWDNYYFSINNPIPLVESREVSKKELIRLIRKAYRKMYLRPSWIMKTVRHVPMDNIVRGILKFFPHCIQRK